MPTKFTIKSGDTLVGIAEQFLNDPRAFIDIVRANPGLFRTLADGTLDLTLQPGQSIIIPSARPEGAPTPFIPFGSSFGVSGADGFTKTTLATKPGGQATTETFASAADVTSGVAGAERQITETGAAFLEQTLTSTASEDAERRDNFGVDPVTGLLASTEARLNAGQRPPSGPIRRLPFASPFRPNLGTTSSMSQAIVESEQRLATARADFASGTTAEERSFEFMLNAGQRRRDQQFAGRRGAGGGEGFQEFFGTPPVPLQGPTAGAARALNPFSSAQKLAQTSVRVMEEIAGGNIPSIIAPAVSTALGLDGLLMNAGYVLLSTGWVRDPALSGFFEPAPSVSSATSVPTSFGGGGFRVSFGGGFGGGRVRGSSRVFKSPAIRWRIGFA